MRFALGHRNHRWRTWSALSANDFAWVALMIGGVLFAALFMDP
jgi:hypothetical protein